jgi:hypothetical protein
MGSYAETTSKPIIGRVKRNVRLIGYDAIERTEFKSMKTRFLWSLLLVVLTSAAGAQTPTEEHPVREMRKHLTLQSRDSTNAFTVTVVDLASEVMDSVKILIQDPKSGRFLLSWDRDFVRQTSIREIREVGGTEFVRYTLFLPFTARTRTATQEQARTHPELMNDKNGRFELSTAGNSSISGTVDFWKDAETAREWRTRARAMLSPPFLDWIETMETAGLFRQPSLVDLDSILMPLLLYRTDCASTPEYVVTTLVPDCAFDKKFGFECSDKQKERAEKYAAETPPATKPY